VAKRTKKQLVGDALDEVYTCAMEFYIVLHQDGPEKEQRELNVATEVASAKARLAGATDAEVSEMVEMADEDAGMLALDTNLLDLGKLVPAEFDSVIVTIDFYPLNGEFVVVTRAYNGKRVSRAGTGRARLLKGALTESLNEILD